MIIDAHVHLPTGGSLRSFTEKKERLLLEMQKNSVDKCIVIADSWPDTEIGSTEECMSLFPKNNPDGVYIVGGISPDVDFENQLEIIRRGIEQKALVGIKLFPGHEKFFLTDKRLDPVYDLAAQTDTPVLFHSGWDCSQFGEVEVAVEVAKRYPDLRLVCSHCWYPLIHSSVFAVPYPNIFFDLSSVADEPERWDRVGISVCELIYSVPNRVMFGSDAFGCSMEQHIKFVKYLGLEKETEDNIFAENAKKIYGI